MKEINQKSPDKIENVKQVSVEKQRNYIGSAKPMPGHTTFEVNYELKTIEKADFDKSSAVSYTDAQEGAIRNSKKISVKKNCVYISALNKQNVLKILKRDFGINF